MWYFITEQRKTPFGHYNDELGISHWSLYCILKIKRLMIYHQTMVYHISYTMATRKRIKLLLQTCKLAAVTSLIIFSNKTQEDNSISNLSEISKVQSNVGIFSTYSFTECKGLHTQDKLNTSSKEIYFFFWTSKGKCIKNGPFQVTIWYILFSSLCWYWWTERSSWKYNITV